MSTQPAPKALNVLRAGIVSLIVGVLLLLAMFLWGTLAEEPPGLVGVGIVLGVVILVAAIGLLVYSRQVRRRHRPEWLETQAWQQGLRDKLQKPSGKGE